MYYLFKSKQRHLWYLAKLDTAIFLGPGTKELAEVIPKYISGYKNIHFKQAGPLLEKIKNNEYIASFSSLPKLEDLHQALPEFYL